MAEEGAIYYLHLSDSTPAGEEEIELADGEKAKVIWKDILVEGEYPMTPGSNGAKNEPMRVIPSGASDIKTNTISMSDLIESHEDEAFKYVTIPTSHKDGLLDNTGYVPKKGLRVVERGAKKVLQAALGFTEPDIKGKVQRGTIPDVSAGVLFGPLNKMKKKRYRAALKHVALTPTPFMGNLDSFKPVFASDDDDLVVNHVYLADEEDVAGGSSSSIIWDETKGLNRIRSAIEEALMPPRVPSEDGDVPSLPRPSYYVEDVDTDNKALVNEYFKGKRARYVVPFTIGSDGSPSLAPAARWTEVKEVMIAASDNNFEDVTPDALRKKLGESLTLAFGDSASEYKVEDISLDSRAKISKKDGAVWIAPFFMLSDGEIQLSVPGDWEAVPVEQKEEKEVVTETQAKITLSDAPQADDLFSRLSAARSKRARLLAG